MKALFQAILTKFNAGGDFKTATGSQLYFVEASENQASFPYAVYGPVYNDPDYYMSEQLEESLLQFDLYSDDSSAVEVLDMFTHLKTMFDDVKLTVSGYTHYLFERGMAHGPFKDPESKIWHMAIEYRAVLQ